MTAVQIVPGGESGGYVATVNGISIPIDAYLVENTENGRVGVSLIIAADQLSIGIPPTRRAEPPQERRNERPVSTWGAPGQADPRANIPGWQPPPGTVDAVRERAGLHRHIGERFTRVLPKAWRLA